MPIAKTTPADIIRMVMRREIVQPPAAPPPEEGPLASLHVAVEGCCHGELDKIYAACKAREAAPGGKKIDVLLCCGDFQCTRNLDDLRSMAVPDKYKTLGDFPAYYRGEKTAPVLTIFIGGNHEASNVLQEEYYGGKVAPNIYYLGHSGVLDVAGLRIAGLSGIFKPRDYFREYPLPPYSDEAIRSAYHVRAVEVDKLTAYAEVVRKRRGESAPELPVVDVMMTHDWPNGITKHGNEEQLIRFKPFFAEDIRHNALGNPRTFPLLDVLRPTRWFAAHLHCRFDAIVYHRTTRPSEQLSVAECAHPSAVAAEHGAEWGDADGFLSWHDGAEDKRQAPTAAVVADTKFLALDKCTRGSNFLEFFDMPVAAERRRVPRRCPTTRCIIPEYDAEWVAVVCASHAAVRWVGISGAAGSSDTKAIAADALIRLQREPPRAESGLSVTTTADFARVLHLSWPPSRAAPPAAASSREAPPVQLLAQAANSKVEVQPPPAADDDIAWHESL